jgi:hypothetical protein
VQTSASSLTRPSGPRSWLSVMVLPLAVLLFSVFFPGAGGTRDEAGHAVLRQVAPASGLVQIALADVAEEDSESRSGESPGSEDSPVFYLCAQPVSLAFAGWAAPAELPRLVAIRSAEPARRGHYDRPWSRGPPALG